MKPPAGTRESITRIEGPHATFHRHPDDSIRRRCARIDRLRAKAIIGRLHITDEAPVRRGFAFLASATCRKPPQPAPCGTPTGLVAEWSCSGLQSRVRRFDSDPGLHLEDGIKPEFSRNSAAKIKKRKAHHVRLSFFCMSAFKQIDRRAKVVRGKVCMPREGPSPQLLHSAIHAADRHTHSVMSPLGLGDAVHLGKRRRERTRREALLAEMEQVIPWDAYCSFLSHAPRQRRRFARCLFDGSLGDVGQFRAGAFQPAELVGDVGVGTVHRVAGGVQFLLGCGQAVLGNP